MNGRRSLSKKKDVHAQHLHTARPPALDRVPLNALPDECLVGVLARLGATSDQRAASLVCRRWLALSKLAFTSLDWHSHVMTHTPRIGFQPKSLVTPALWAAISRATGEGAGAGAGAAAVVTREQVERAMVAILLGKRFPALKRFECSFAHFGQEEEDRASWRGGDAFAALSVACPRLEALSVAGLVGWAPNVLTTGLLTLGAQGVRLRQLSCCPHAPPEILPGIAAHSASLESLTLGTCGPGELVTIADSCRALVHLKAHLQPNSHRPLADAAAAAAAVSPFAPVAGAGLREVPCLERALESLPRLERLHIGVSCGKAYGPALRAICRAASASLRELAVVTRGHEDAPPRRRRRAKAAEARAPTGGGGPRCAGRQVPSAGGSYAQRGRTAGRGG